MKSQNVKSITGEGRQVVQYVRNGEYWKLTSNQLRINIQTCRKTDKIHWEAGLNQDLERRNFPDDIVSRGREIVGRNPQMTITWTIAMIDSENPWVNRKCYFVDRLLDCN